MASRLPSVFISHGAPTLYLDTQLDTHQFLKRLLKNVGVEARPKAVVVVSAHWDEDVIAVTTGEKPQQIYDFYGFQKEAYEFKYNVRGSPELAKRVLSLLSGQGLSARGDERRGFDHGAWSPLCISFPEADVPFVQVSLHSDFSPAVHYTIGKALSPLQYENVMIIASGGATHNLGLLRMGYGPNSAGPKFAALRRFDNHLRDILTLKVGEERRAALMKLYEHPDCSTAHPTYEHLAPVFVAAGANENAQGRMVHSLEWMGLSLNSFAF